MIYISLQHTRHFSGYFQFLTKSVLAEWDTIEVTWTPKGLPEGDAIPGLRGRSWCSPSRHWRRSKPREVNFTARSSCKGEGIAAFIFYSTTRAGKRDSSSACFVVRRWKHIQVRIASAQNSHQPSRNLHFLSEMIIPKDSQPPAGIRFALRVQLAYWLSLLIQLSHRSAP